MKLGKDNMYMVWPWSYTNTMNGMFIVIKKDEIWWIIMTMIKFISNIPITLHQLFVLENKYFHV